MTYSMTRAATRHTSKKNEVESFYSKKDGVCFFIRTCLL